MAHFGPLWLQDGSYSATADRQLIAALWPAGGASGGAVTAVTNTMTVSVAAGYAAVPLTGGQGSALCRWDAAEIPPALGASPPSGQSRIDLIVVQVRDTALDSGANVDFVLQVVAGTPAATPTVPAVPANALALAQVLVPGTVANLNTATFTDLRPLGHCEASARSGGQQVSSAATPTKILLDSVEGGGGYDLTNHWYVCPIPGRYRMDGAVTFDRGLSLAIAHVYKNGGGIGNGIAAGVLPRPA